MSETSYKKTIVLVVEDERPLANAVSKKLERAGYQVLVARTGEQAMQYVEDDDFDIDLIWLDHYLIGKQTGLDVLAKLKKADSPYRAIPVFLVSNSVSEHTVKNYIQLGVDKYYAKMDVRLDEVIKDITVALSGEKE